MELLFCYICLPGPLESSLLPTKAMFDFTRFVEAKLNTSSNGPLFIFRDELCIFADFVAFAYAESESLIRRYKVLGIPVLFRK